MNLLSMCQKFAKRTNIKVPGEVLGSGNPQIQQLYNLLEEEGNDLAQRGDWQELTNEATHTTLAVENQGTIKSIASNGFSYIKNGTIWDRSLQLPVYVVDGTDWQQVKAIAVTGPRYQARIRGGNLIANPVPVAGNTWAFEYMTYNWIQDSAGANDAQYFAADTDVPVLPEELLLLGLRWRWLREKGLEYSEAFRTYEGQVKNHLTRNNMRRVLDMGFTTYTPSPRIYVAEGSWSL